MGHDLCSMIQRPVATCHHKSEPRITVYPNDQKEGMTARYHKAELIPGLGAGNFTSTVARLVDHVILG